MLTTLFVTDDGDSGDDTFRAAITAANGDSSVDTIVFDGIGTVGLDAVIEYTGMQALSIDGNGATIEASTFGANDLLISSGGADLSLSHLTFQNGDNGVLVPVPSGATGTVAVSLDNVTIKDNSRYGLHLNDQLNDSDASVRIDVADSTITGNGTGEGVSDFDGIRADDGGEGSVVANIMNSHFDNNGADGLELDERGPGGISADIVDSTFNENGFQDPDDKEDGIDFDETDAGDLWVQVVDSTFNGNADEGLDLDEELGGDVEVSLFGVNANGNEDEGIKIDEKALEDENEDPIPGTSDGDLVVSLIKVRVNGSQGEEGIAIAEQGAGNFDATFEDVVANGNAKEGIDLSEEGDGDLTADLEDVVANGNDDEGIQIEEADDGDLAVTMRNVRAQGNSKSGVKVEQGAPGDGTLELDNLKGSLDTDGVTIV